MSKRGAGWQLTREELEQQDEDDRQQEQPFTAGGSVASSEAMSRRKIAMPKGRKATAGITGLFPAQRQQKTTADPSRGAKLKALNLQLQDKINKSLLQDLFADLTPVCEKYIEYMKTLDALEAPTVKPSNSTPIEIDDKDTGSDENEDKKEETKVEGPKFTLDTKPPTSDSVFTFGTALAKKKEAEKDSDSEGEVEIKGPQFSFSGTVESNVFKLDEAKMKEEKPKPFSFGTNGTETIDSKKDNPFTSKPAAPAFSFGAKKDESTTDTDTKKPVFSFGNAPSTITSNDSQEKPVSFNFGSAKPSTTDTEKENNANTPSFGTAESNNIEQSNEKSTKPSFSFNFNKNNNEATTTKPTFSFANNSKTAIQSEEKAKPSFTFGSSINSTPPTFSFGSKPKLEQSSSESKDKTSAPSGGFKFSLPFNQKQNVTAEPANAQSTETNPEKPNEEEKGENNDDKTSATPIDLQNGEEDENCLFAKKAKLMIFNSETKKYDSKGVGEMKLLQRKDENAKIRFLCRSEGMGHILLNTNLVKTFNFAPLTGERTDLIKTPTVDADGKLMTYVVKFEKKDDGKTFIDAIEAAKTSM